MSDLVKRLRRCTPSYIGKEFFWQDIPEPAQKFSDLCTKAADRISELEVDRDFWKSAFKKRTAIMDQQEGRIKELEDRLNNPVLKSDWQKMQARLDAVRTQVQLWKGGTQSAQETMYAITHALEQKNE